jgi:hypothetical protein
MPSQPTLPTLLIKMQPWTAAEINDLDTFLLQPGGPSEDRMSMVENPLDPGKSFLSPEFYSGDFSDELDRKTLVFTSPRTDDKPYFRTLRKSLNVLTEDRAHFLDSGTASVINDYSKYSKGIPMDWIHLFLTGAASLLYMVLFVVLPLRFSKIAKQGDMSAGPLLTYFSCLGAGFITIEIVFIQKFTHLIGSPLYTYSTVLFTMLVAAGIGSAASEKFGIDSHRRQYIPFVMILLLGTALTLLYPALSHLALELPIAGRILASAARTFPLGLFLGMPFPLGILAIENRPRALVAWAWGMNGLFTVVGGFLSMLISMAVGFNIAIMLALGLYAVAFSVFKALRGTEYSPAIQAVAASAAASA